MGNGVYSYQATNLRTGAILGNLPLTGVRWSKRLMRTGTASGQFLISKNMDPQRIANLRAMTTIDLCGVYIIRNGYPIWGGPIWGRSYDSSSRMVSLTMETFESYWAKRIQRQSRTFHSVAGAWGAADGEQIGMARWLLNNAAAATGGNIQIVVDGTTVGPVLRDHQYNYWEFRSVLDELNALATVDGGFEYSVEIYLKTDGTIGRRILFGYPRIGRSADTTDLNFIKPGNIKKYTPNEDATTACTTEYAIGAGEGPSQLTSSRTAQSLINGGYALLENVHSYKDVTVQQYLDDRAVWDLNNEIVPIALVGVEIKPDVDRSTQLERIVPGDYAKFRVTDDPWQPLRTTTRITQLDVSAADQGGIETATLTLGAGGVV